MNLTTKYERRNVKAHVIGRFVFHKLYYNVFGLREVKTTEGKAFGIKF